MAQATKKEEPKQGLDYSENGSMLMRKKALLNNEEMSDVVFLVGPGRQRIFAHKLLLSISSEYFYVMFNSDFAESKMGEVELLEHDPTVFLETLRYIYTNEFAPTLVNCHDIFYNAQKFLLTELSRQIENFLLSAIEEETLKIFNDNRYYGYKSIDDKCLELISDNPLYYFNHVDLQNIDKETFGMILKLERLNCSEEQLQMALEIYASGPGQSDMSDLYEQFKEIKRCYNCQKLLLFGLPSIADGRHLLDDVKFSITSDKPVSLYGIGAYIWSTSPVVSLELSILEGAHKLDTESYEVKNKHIGVMHVTNLWFEKIVLQPRQLYSIRLSYDSTNRGFKAKELKCFANNISINFHCSFDDSYCTYAVAHIFCKSNLPKNQSNDNYG